MSFISSFIEKADDSSKTAIGYGLNDCTGRLVEVDKKDIVRLLYPEPMDMVFEQVTKHNGIIWFSTFDTILVLNILQALP